MWQLRIKKSCLTHGCRELFRRLAEWGLWGTFEASDVGLAGPAQGVFALLRRTYSAPKEGGLESASLARSVQPGCNGSAGSAQLLKFTDVAKNSQAKRPVTTFT